MSGRIVPSNRVKRGEVLPPEYEALGEETQDPLRYSAQIEAVYLEAQRRDREVFSIDATVAGKDVVGEDSGSNLEERMAEYGDYYREYDLSDPRIRKAVMADIEYRDEHGQTRVGMSSTFAKHLAGLPRKHKEMMEEQAEIKGATSGRGSGRIGRHKSMSSSSATSHAYNIAPAGVMRAKVLAHSLYPNLNNKKFLLGSM